MKIFNHTLCIFSSLVLLYSCKKTDKLIYEPVKSLSVTSAAMDLQNIYNSFAFAHEIATTPKTKNWELSSDSTITQKTITALFNKKSNLYDTSLTYGRITINHGLPYGTINDWVLIRLEDYVTSDYQYQGTIRYQKTSRNALFNSYTLLFDSIKVQLGNNQRNIRGRLDIHTYAKNYIVHGNCESYNSDMLYQISIQDSLFISKDVVYDFSQINPAVKRYFNKGYANIKIGSYAPLLNYGGGENDNLGIITDSEAFRYILEFTAF